MGHLSLKRYEVTVTNGPLTVGVWARDEGDAAKKAAYMIGPAGLLQEGRFEVTYVGCTPAPPRPP